MIKEKRNIASTGANIRAINASGSIERYIEGYAALFNQESRILYEYHNDRMVEFTEIIENGAFDEILSSSDLNVIHTIDHYREKMLARTKSGTLQLSVDETGLKYRFSVPNTTLGNDLFEMVSRGDYYESSFVFTIEDDGDRWEKRGDKVYRYISKISGLYDTSTVIDGAYSNTKVEIARDLKEFFDKPIEHDAKTVDIDFEFNLLKGKQF